MKACPICNSNNLQLWGIKNDYSLYLCELCTHIFADIESKLDGTLNNLPEEVHKSMFYSN